MASAQQENGQSHLQARFFTKQQGYRIADTPYSIPGNVGRSELNSLINKVLQQDEIEEVTFDFLINGVHLHGTVQEYLSQQNISTESVLEIEYILSRETPQIEQTLLHDDWVSSVDVCGNIILTGSYDNLIRLWDTTGRCLAVLEGHSGAAKDVTFVAKDSGGFTFISGSHDQTIMLWQWSEVSKKGVCHHLCRGHAGSVDTLAVHPEKEKFCSGSWDKMIKVWSAEIKLDEKEKANEDDLERSKKKLREDKSQKMASTRTPLQTLSGHREAVSSLIWLSSNELCSGSWDHTIKIWDIENGSTNNNIVGSKVINSLSYCEESNVIAVGSTDRMVRFCDPRCKDGVVLKSSPLYHDGFISSVSWCQGNCHELVTGSFDTSVKVWDVRSTSQSLFDITDHHDKVMCVNWKQPELILSGGADATLQLHRYNKKPPTKDG